MAIGNTNTNASDKDIRRVQLILKIICFRIFTDVVKFF